jgi:hypothetical protein
MITKALFAVDIRDFQCGTLAQASGRSSDSFGWMFRKLVARRGPVTGTSSRIRTMSDRLAPLDMVAHVSVTNAGTGASP